jgi:hypothetical protein
MRVIAFCVQFLIFITQADKSIPNTSYIILEYKGPSDKPAPIIIFYTETFEEKGWMEYNYFVRKYKVSIKCWNLIYREIQNFDSAFNNPENKSLGYYTMEIQNEDKTQRCFVNNKNNTERLLGNILMVIEDSSIKANVKRRFKDVSERIY